MFAYIDESGESGFSKRSSTYFLIAASLFFEEFTAERIAKKVFKKSQLGKQKKNHIHATDENDKVKNKFISEIKNYDFKIEYDVVEKRREEYDYYEEVFERLLTKLAKYNVEKVFVSIKDSRKSVLKKLNTIARKNGLQVIFSRPEKVKGLQIADFVSWSVFQKYEKAESKYYDLLQK